MLYFNYGEHKSNPRSKGGEKVEALKQEVVENCMCDCLPCKMEGDCKKCNLGISSKGAFTNGYLCHEGDNSDYVIPHNQALTKVNRIIEEL